MFEHKAERMTAGSSVGVRVKRVALPARTDPAKAAWRNNNNNRTLPLLGSNVARTY